jgi:branched-chain amino acid aminotransferase
MTDCDDASIAKEGAMTTSAGWSRTWTFLDGDWHEGNVPIMGVRTHAAWLGTMVFDGARAFEGVAPDIDLHCARVNASARTMALNPVVAVDQWVGLVRDGMRRFDPGTTLYIRPMYWADRASPQAVPPDPESTRWCLTLYDAPMRRPEGFSVTLSPFRRPTIETAMVDAKASCLYPNNARAMLEARSRGFDNCIVCDMLGNVAELANSNVFLAKDGVIFTPAPNGTFLNGITRQRVIALLRAEGSTVIETTLRYRDFESADEIFATGNASKVLPVTRIGERSLQPGPVFRRARALYWDYAHGR